jgi:hypothetical protein
LLFELRKDLLSGRSFFISSSIFSRKGAKSAKKNATILSTFTLIFRSALDQSGQEDGWESNPEIAFSY